MLELINTTAQTVSANNAVALGSVSISDGAQRMVLSGTDAIELKTPGKYKIDATFVVANTGSSAVNYDLQIYANGVAQGIPIDITVPENGESEIYIQKTIRAIPSSYGNVATIQFVSVAGVIVNKCLVDIYKRS